MQKLYLTLLLAGGACGHLRGAAPDGRELRIFLNERVAGPRGQRDGVGPDNKNARARRRARQHLRAQKKEQRRLQEPDPEDDEYYHDDDFRYEDTVEDAREAFIFFVVVACFVCCCCGSCAARRLARRNYPHGRELRRPLLDDTDAEVALGSSGEDWPCPVCRHANPPSRACCDVCRLSRKDALSQKDAYENEARRVNGLEARKEPASPSLANFFSRSTEDDEAPVVLTPLQKRAARRHRWRRAVEDDGIVWRGDDSSPASVVLELREDNAVIVEAAGATADLVGEGSLGHEYASRTKPDELERASGLPFREKYLWFERELDSIRSAPGDGYARLDVRRDRLLEDSVQQLLALEPKHLRRWMRVQFSDEPGIDVGGLEREWFSLACGAILDQDVGVFSGASDGGLRFDPSASLPPDLGGHPRSRELYEFFGRFIGKALLERVPLDARLASPIYAQLLGRVVAFEDLQCLDDDLAKNLRWLLDQKDVSELGLDFSVSIARQCPFGHGTSSNDEFVAASQDVVVRELIENGRDTPVTNDNVQDYVRLLWRHHACANDAAWHLARGLYAVLPPDLLSVFDAYELELLLCGAEEVDVDDWEKHTEYAGEYRRRGANHPVVKWWWRAVRALEPQDRAKLLQFCTGSARVPSFGFRALQRNDGRFQRFCVQSLPRTAPRFPRAHTCFNRVDLPLYASYAELAAGLRVVLAMEATGFTMD